MLFAWGPCVQLTLTSLACPIGDAVKGMICITRPTWVNWTGLKTINFADSIFKCISLDENVEFWTPQNQQTLRIPQKAHFSYICRIDAFYMMAMEWPQSLGSYLLAGYIGYGHMVHGLLGLQSARIGTIHTARRQISNSEQQITADSLIFCEYFVENWLLWVVAVSSIQNTIDLHIDQSWRWSTDYKFKAYK